MAGSGGHTPTGITLERNKKIIEGTNGAEENLETPSIKYKSSSYSCTLKDHDVVWLSLQPPSLHHFISNT